MDSTSIPRRSVASDLVEISGHLQTIKGGGEAKVAATKNDLQALWNVGTKDPVTVPKSVAHLQSVADNPLHPYSKTATEILGGSNADHDALVDVFNNEDRASASSIAKVTSMAGNTDHPLNENAKQIYDTATKNTETAAVQAVADAKAKGTKASTSAQFATKQIAAKPDHPLNAAATEALAKVPSTSWWSRLTGGH